MNEGNEYVGPDERDSGVSEEERQEALDPNVGGGTPDTAPEFPWPEPGLAAYRKAIAAGVTAVAGALATFGVHVDQQLEQLVVALLVAVVVARVPNER